jgi:hypothetical protein
MRIVVAVEAVDFRRGIDGLARLCRETLDSDPFAGWLFVFRNRRAAAIKILTHDAQGSRLATAGFFSPPRAVVCSHYPQPVFRWRACRRAEETRLPSAIRNPMTASSRRTPVEAGRARRGCLSVSICMSAGRTLIGDARSAWGPTTCIAEAEVRGEVNGRLGTTHDGRPGWRKEGLS